MVTVIVPIYNAEKYLKKCIESIIYQTYKEIEIILINDGSTDASGEICDRYAQIDNRIVVVHNTNHGLVYSRKIGLQNAKGDYVVFCDSDDYMDTKAIQYMYRCINIYNSDIVVCGYIMDKNNQFKNIKNQIDTGLYTKEQLGFLYGKIMYDDEYMSPSIIQSMCGKLFKRELLIEVSKTIDDKITLGEDAAFVYPYLLECDSIFISGECLYHYCIRNDSMCSRKDVSVFERLEAFQQYLTLKFSKYPEEYNLSLQLKKYIVHLIEMAIRNNFGINYSIQYQFSEEIIKQITDKKLIVYGAGEVGQAFVLALKSNGINPVWVDKNKYGQVINNIRIDNIEVVNKDIDIITVAVLNQALFESIKKELSEFVEEEKIVWVLPNKNTWKRNIRFI